MGSITWPGETKGCSEPQHTCKGLQHHSKVLSPPKDGVQPNLLVQSCHCIFSRVEQNSFITRFWILVLHWVAVQLWCLWVKKSIRWKTEKRWGRKQGQFITVSSSHQHEQCYARPRATNPIYLSSEIHRKQWNVAGCPVNCCKWLAHSRLLHIADYCLRDKRGAPSLSTSNHLFA